MENAGKSLYALELSVPPGGARKGLCFIYNNLEDIQRELATDLRIDLQAAEGLLYCYGEKGETVNLLTFIDGEERQRLNLRPYITVRGEDGTEFTLGERGLPGEIDQDSVCDEDFLSSAQAHIDWSAVKVLPLTGDLLQPGEALELQIGYVDYPVLLQYGFNDLEGEVSAEEYYSQIEEFDAEMGIEE
jgi:hypothetical protein